MNAPLESATAFAQNEKKNHYDNGLYYIKKLIHILYFAGQYFGYCLEPTPFFPDKKNEGLRI